MRKSFLCLYVICFVLTLVSCKNLAAQQAAAPTGQENAAPQHDPLDDLSPEDRALFDTLRQAAQQGNDAVVVANGKKLLPVLKPGTRLAAFVTQVTAQSALETGDTAYALSIVKPLAEAYPADWQIAALLTRLYAESGDKTLRDQQIAHLIKMHKQTQDPDFAKLHIFPIQKVKLNSGYAVFLYPFEPLKPYNTYLIAAIYTSEGKEDYHLDIESDDVDQAFFKGKPGERRFSIDSYHANKDNPNGPEDQALHSFIDGAFDYDAMRDQLVKVANGDQTPQK